MKEEIFVNICNFADLDYEHFRQVLKISKFNIYNKKIFFHLTPIGVINIEKSFILADGLYTFVKIEDVDILNRRKIIPLFTYERLFSNIIVDIGCFQIIPRDDCC